MARPRRVNCIVCNRHIDECGALSTTARCEDCGIGEATRQQMQLHEHDGYHFKRWRARSIAALGIEVPDDLKPYLEKP